MNREDQVRIYDPAKSAVFLKTNERFGGLSNMAPGFAVVVNGVRIRTSEALYQACRFPHLPHVQRLIISEHSPMTAKMRGKPYASQTRPDWDRVRVGLMRWCLRVKLNQNPSKFSSLLRSTGDLPIVEKKTRRSDFWGAKLADDGSLVGMNVLGRLLMELRAELEAKGIEAFDEIPPPNIEGLFLYDRRIGVIRRPIKEDGDADTSLFSSHPFR